MNSGWLDLDAYVSRLSDACTRRGENFRVDYGRAYLPSSKALWEAHFQRTCPAELVAMTSAFDGASFSASGGKWGEDTFTIRSLEEMVRQSKERIVDFFSVVAEDPTNGELYSARRARQLCDVATFGDDDQLVMIDFDRDETGCVIVDSSPESKNLPRRPFAVADSLATLLRRCLQARTIGGFGDGFCYFFPRTLLDGDDETHWLRYEPPLDIGGRR